MWYKTVIGQLALMLVCAALLSSSPLLIRASEKDSTIQYNALTVTFLIEAVKLLISLFVLAFISIKGNNNGSNINTTNTTLTWRESIIFAPTAFLYMIDNNLMYYILLYMNPATLSIVWNIRIVTTALMFQFILKKKLSKLKWTAIVLLLLGVVTSASNKHFLNNAEDGEGEGKQEEASSSFSDFTIGMLLVLIGVNISSAAGIYTEWAMKRRVDDSIFLQNVHLYFYGVLTNGLALMYSLKKEENYNKSFFNGYDEYTIAIIISGTMIGLFVGVLYKFLDNIVVSYAHAIAMFFTTIISLVYFSFDISLEFICGLSVCVVSMYLYHMEEIDKGQLQQQQQQDQIFDEDYQPILRKDNETSDNEENGLEVLENSCE